MEAICTGKSSVDFKRNTRRRILEDKTVSVGVNVEAVSLVTKVWIRDRKIQVRFLAEARGLSLLYRPAPGPT
jgi:hypothetical protein